MFICALQSEINNAELVSIDLCSCISILMSNIDGCVRFYFYAGCLHIVCCWLYKINPAAS